MDSRVNLKFVLMLTAVPLIWGLAQIPHFRFVRFQLELNQREAKQLLDKTAELKARLSSAGPGPASREDLLTVSEITALQLRRAALTEEGLRVARGPQDTLSFGHVLIMMLILCLSQGIADVRKRLPEKPVT